MSGAGKAPNLEQYERKVIQICPRSRSAAKLQVGNRKTKTDIETKHKVYTPMLICNICFRVTEPIRFSSLRMNESVFSDGLYR